jgi:hypothetical protein
MWRGQNHSYMSKYMQCILRRFLRRFCYGSTFDIVSYLGRVGSYEIGSCYKNYEFQFTHRTTNEILEIWLSWNKNFVRLN